MQKLLQKDQKLKFVCLIDAMDESFTRFDSNSILLLVSNIKSNSLPIRFIITTRDKGKIINSFTTDKKISLSEEYIA